VFLTAAHGGADTMIERFKKGFRLVGAAWDVLKADRELLVLPILSFLSAAALMVLLFFGLFADDLSVLRDNGPLQAPTAVDWIVIALVTYALSYVTIFFNVALVCAADDRMTGGDPTVRSALSDAWRHAGAIAPWALVSVVVGTILRAVEERAGTIGRIAAGLLGLAWALITYLVLPVLVLEGLSVKDAITRSKDLFVKTWGETVSGELGMSLVTFLAVLVAVPPLLLIGGGGQPVMVALAVALAIAWLIIVAVVMGALNVVFRVALYRYAADGEAPEGFAHLDLGHVFPPKRRRGLFGRTV
jgi:Family of unknown function (DUF6159)